MTLPQFIDIPACNATLGWRFDDVLPETAAAAIDAYFGSYDYRAELFSPNRTVHVEQFSIATEPVLWSDLIDASDDIYDIDSLHEACTRTNARLRVSGLRLPSEDELEVAIGGGLFPWGNDMPDGIPYPDGTRFTAHKERTSRGLQLEADTYVTELVDGYFKLGDGGTALCGADPWPIPWLSLSPAFRVPTEMYDTCLPEFLETAVVRPVRTA